MRTFPSVLPVPLLFLLACGSTNGGEAPTDEPAGAGSSSTSTGGASSLAAVSGSSGDSPSSLVMSSSSSSGSGGVPDQGVEGLNPGWIGGGCTSNADCSYMDGVCRTEAEGFPGGMCTQPCSLFCPDMAGPLNTATFCVDDDGMGTGGSCFARCDDTLSPTGCRLGYVCMPEKRNTQTVVRDVRVPRSGLPDRPEPAFDIGEACTSASDCNRASCITAFNGGYCTSAQCDVMGCPAGSSCWVLGGTERRAVCLKDCTSGSQCRESENYTCDGDNTCFPGPAPAATCNTDGSMDCSAYAGMVTEDFVVVTKGQRRMTLCNGAAVVGSWCIGLGFSPVGDKEREGDGRTPEGIFYVPRVLPDSMYYKAFLLSYPDAADAQSGLMAGLITQAEHDAIVMAQAARTEPPQETGLGGLIEIHGMGGSSDWTWGCIAADNNVIDILWPVLNVGDNIVVRP